MINRREFIRAGAAAGALLIASPRAAFGGSPIARFGTSRASRLFPGDKRFCIHSDLHNHTLLSDGVSDADDAFPMMRKAGLDVAALTDHAVMGKLGGEVTCSKHVDPKGSNGRGTCSQIVGINEESWRTLGDLAQRNNDGGRFVALRGFEWTTTTLGHINVWFSQTWIDSHSTGSLQSFRAAGEVARQAPAPGPEFAPLFAELPETATIDGFYDWLQRAPGDLVLGGGSDGVAGFNHPNEFGDFNGYQYFGSVADRIVSCEVHNGPTLGEGPARDYWFWGVRDGKPWPINACLNAGWHVGLLGVSDNHSDKFGVNNAGRGGLWVRELTARGVREALLTRRMFSTTLSGLRLDASANGVPMGGRVPHNRGAVRFRLDLDRGKRWYGRKLFVEVAAPGSDEPRLIYAKQIQLRSPLERPVEFTLDLNRGEAPWIVLRITDPTQPLDEGATGRTWTRHGGAVAYASPFYFVKRPSGA